MRRFRRGGLPAAARDALALERGERVLAWAPAGKDSYLVATDRALHLPAGTRVGWEHIDHVEWQRGGVHVREIAALDETPARHQVRVPEPFTLPDVVRERVTSSIAINQHVPLQGTRGVRIVARRRHGRDDVVWNLVFDAGLDVHDPQLRAHADALLAQVRRQTGL